MATHSCHANTGTTRDQHKGRCCCNNSQDICSLAFSSNLTIFDSASTSTEKRFLYIIVNNPIQEPIVIIWNNLIAQTNKNTLFYMWWLSLAIFLLPIKIFYWPQKVLWGRWIQNIQQQQRESSVQTRNYLIEYISQYPHPSSPSDSHSTPHVPQWPGLGACSWWLDHVLTLSPSHHHSSEPQHCTQGALQSSHLHTCDWLQIVCIYFYFVV